MAGGSAYSIIVDTELDLSNIREQLKKVDAKVKIGAEGEKVSKTVSKAKKETEGLEKSAKNVGLTFQEANMIMEGSARAIGKMAGQVFEVDTAMREFRKVSDFSDTQIEKYTKNLSEVGKTVGRTG